MFIPKQVTPTVWCVGHVIPAHTMFFHASYSQGLLTNTMEGREAKHITLIKLSQNTTYQDLWMEIFRHEYVKLVWLREQEGYSSGAQTTNKCVYIPPRVESREYCYCGLMKADPQDPYCCFCDEMMKEIECCVKGKAITKKMNALLKKAKSC